MATPPAADQDDRADEDPSAPDEPDYYVEGGCVVFTAAYHRRRGYCCESGCRHCPYGYESGPPPDPDPGG